MSLVENDICEITESIWTLILGLPVTPRAGIVAADRKDDFVIGRVQITGYVQIHGAWEVTVLLECSEALARRVTATMFDMDADDIAPDDLRDAVGELTNMISGSFKSLLPGTCTLSIPLVRENGVHNGVAVAGTTVASQVAFACEGELFLVTLLMPDTLRPSVLKSIRRNGEANGQAAEPDASY